MLGDAFLWILTLVASCHGTVLPDSPQTASDSAVSPNAITGGGGGGSAPLRNPGYVRMPVSRHKYNGTGKSRKGWHWSPPPGCQGFPPSPPRAWPSSPFQNTASTGQQPASGRPTLKPGFSGPPTLSRPLFPTPSFSTSARPSSSAPILSTLTTVTKPAPTASSSAPPTALSLLPRQYQNDRRWGWSSLDELGGIAYIIQRESSLPPILALSPNPDSHTCSGNRNAAPEGQGLYRHGLVRTVGESEVQHFGFGVHLPEPWQLLPQQVQLVQPCWRRLFGHLRHGCCPGKLLV